MGIEGWYDALEAVIRSYGADATGIYFPSAALVPAVPSSNRPGDPRKAGAAS